jgi:hypothetical protein
MTSTLTIYAMLGEPSCAMKKTAVKCAMGCYSLSDFARASLLTFMGEPVRAPGAENHEYLH